MDQMIARKSWKQQNLVIKNAAIVCVLPISK